MVCNLLLFQANMNGWWSGEIEWGRQDTLNIIVFSGKCCIFSTLRALNFVDNCWIIVVYYTLLGRVICSWEWTRAAEENVNVVNNKDMYLSCWRILFYEIIRTLLMCALTVLFQSWQLKWFTCIFTKVGDEWVYSFSPWR